MMCEKQYGLISRTGMTCICSISVGARIQNSAYRFAKTIKTPLKRDFDFIEKAGNLE